MSDFFSKLRYAFRSLAMRPGFTAMVILTLALGIGTNSLIFSVVDEVLLKPLPYSESERLVRMWESNPQKGFDRFEVSTPNFVDWRSQAKSFEALAAYSTANVTLTGVGNPEVLMAADITPSLLSVLRIKPVVGRVFLPEEERPNSRVVLLSYKLWQRLFGTNRDVVGRQLVLNGQGYSVVGVLPEDFELGSNDIELWAPMEIGSDPGPRGARYLDVIGRLRTDVSLEQAQREMQTIAGRLVQEYPDSNAGWGVAMVPLQEYAVEGLRPALRVLFFAVGLVLLIACGNVANLLLVRTAGRSRELAVRQALGAGSREIARPLLLENLLLALIGAAVGLFLAALGIRILAAIAPKDLSRLTEVSIDGRLVLFTLGIALLSVLLFGLIPVFQAMRPAMNETLKSGGRAASPGRGAQRLRNGLIVAELALAMILLFGAALLLRSFWTLQSVDPGFEKENVLIARVALPPSRYGEVPQRTAFYERLLERANALPGVLSAGGTSVLPLHDLYFGFEIEGRPPAPSGEEPQVLHRAVTPDYFRAMGIPALKGRVFTPRDRTGTPGVAVIDQAMARQFFPGEDPIGKRINFSDPAEWLEIIGVVGEVRQLGLNQEPVPGVYVPTFQTGGSRMYILLRTSGDPRALVETLRQQVRELDADVPLYSIETMEERLSSSIAQSRFNTWLLGVFSLFAVALAVVGIYGVVSYSVSHRKFEIGTRIALGAGRREILLLILGQGLKLIVLGVGIGLLGAFALARLLTSLLFGVEASDPVTALLVTLLLGLVALLACYVPARRAMGVDPILVLKYE